MVATISSLPVSPVPAREAAEPAPGPLAPVRQAEQILDMPLRGDMAACEQVAACIADLNAMPTGGDLLRQIRRQMKDSPGAQLYVSARAEGAPAGSIVGEPAGPRSWTLRLPLLNQTSEGAERSREGFAAALLIALSGLLDKDRAWMRGTYLQNGMSATTASVTALCRELCNLAALPLPDFITDALGESETTGAARAGVAVAARNPYMRPVPREARIPTATHPPAAAAAMAAAAAGAGAMRPAGRIPAGPYLQPQLAGLETDVAGAASAAGQRVIAPQGQPVGHNAPGNEVVRRLMAVPAGLEIASEIELRKVEITALDAKEFFRVPNEIGLSVPHARLIATFDTLRRLLVRADQATHGADAFRGFAEVRPTLDDFRGQLGCPTDPREVALRAWQEDLAFEPRSVILADDLRRALAAGEPPPDPLLFGLPPFPDTALTATGDFDNATLDKASQHGRLAAMAGRI